MSVVSLALGSHGVLFSNLCNSVFHCLEGMTLSTVRTLRTVPSHCTIESSASMSFPSHVPACQAVSALFSASLAFEIGQSLQIHTVLPVIPFASSKVRSMTIFMSVEAIQYELGMLHKPWKDTVIRIDLGTNSFLKLKSQSPRLSKQCLLHLNY